MDYYERQQDRADNRRERTERDEDFAFEQRHQLQLGSNTTRRSTPDAAVQANELYGISPRAQRKASRADWITVGTLKAVSSHTQ